MPAFLLRRRIWRFSVLFIVCLAALAIWSLWLLSQRGHLVNEAAFAQIREGMTPEELKELLGASNLRSVGYQRALTKDGLCVPLHAAYHFSEDDGSWLIPGDTIVVDYQGGHLTKYYRKATAQEIMDRIGERIGHLLGKT